MRDLDLTLSGGETARVCIKRHAMARRLTLRVDRRDHVARISIPKTCTRADAVRFARQHTAWIEKHLGQLPKPIALVPGARVPLLGVERQIVHAKTVPARVHDLGDALHVGGDPARVGLRVQSWLKLRARHEITQRAEAFADETRLEFARITLRDTRSRWGSCSASGGLNFSWRLVMTPPDVLDYVVAHEVAHLEHMNHGPEFWGLVEQLVPDRNAPRRWLRKQGPRLLRYCAKA